MPAFESLALLAFSSNAGSGESVQMHRSTRAYVACIMQTMDVVTHLSRMYLPILINLTCPCPVSGLLGGNFHCYSNFKRNSGEPDQTPRSVASDLVLHYWPMS